MKIWQIWVATALSSGLLQVISAAEFQPGAVPLGTEAAADTAAQQPGAHAEQTCGRRLAAQAGRDDTRVLSRAAQHAAQARQGV